MAGEQEMDEDFILEIIARLPLKYAVQCSVLNKNIRRWCISRPDFLPHFWTIFYCSNHNPKILTSIWQAIRSRTGHPLRRSVTLNELFWIKASCNGLLLLQLRESRDFLVFNPTTGGITCLGRGIMNASIGFVVTNSGFKLVVVWYGKLLRFMVLVPGSRGEVLVESQVSYQLGFWIYQLLVGEPVYANGNLYWLGQRGDDGNVTVSFDVEKVKGRLITGPVVGNEVIKWWFGSAENSIYFVYSLASEMVILTLITDKWDVMHRVSKPREYDDDKPLFFDGRRLLFVLRKCGEGADIYRYDLVMDVWEKIESLESWTEGCSLKFFSYTSTFVKVSSSAYPDEKHVEREFRSHDFLVLQKLLTPADYRPIHVPTRAIDMDPNKSRETEGVH